jgi:hypothetical protein
MAFETSLTRSSSVGEEAEKARGGDDKARKLGRGWKFGTTWRPRHAERGRSLLVDLVYLFKWHQLAQSPLYIMNQLRCLDVHLSTVFAKVRKIGGCFFRPCPSFFRDEQTSG